MALIGSIAINMKVMTKPLAKGLTSARKQINDFGKSISGISSILAGLAAGGAAGFGLAKMTQDAIALGEQTDRARIVFGEFAGDVTRQADLMAEAFGVSKQEFISSASALAAIFKGAGYSKKDSAELSVSFVKLATDLSSLAHIPVAEALAKIESGLVGQVRPLREVGILMSEEAVKAYAAAHGIGQLGKDLTESEKVQARVGFLTNALADAHGNLALTADSAGNTVRSLSGRLENLGTTIGQAILGIVGPAMSDLQIGIEAASLAWTDQFGKVESGSIGVANAMEGQAQSVGLLQRVIGKLADMWDVVRLAFFGFQSYVTWGLGKVIGGLSILGGALDTIVEKLTGMKLGIGDFMKTWAEDLNTLSEKQWGDFQKKLAEPWPSEQIGKYFDQARNKIAETRKVLAAPTTDVTKLVPTAAGAAKAAEAPKFASAMTAGSSAAANTILRSQFGQGGGGTAADKTAKNTAQANILSQQQVAELRKLNMAMRAGKAPLDQI
jgi:hypothetical protein